MEQIGKEIPNSIFGYSYGVSHTMTKRPSLTENSSSSPFSEHQCYGQITHTHEFKVGKNIDQRFPKPKITTLNVLFCPQPKVFCCTVIEEEGNKKKNHIQDARNRDFWCFLFKTDSRQLINYQNRWLSKLIDSYISHRNAERCLSYSTSTF